MSEDIALAIHNDDLPSIAHAMPSPHETIACGKNWTIVSADVSGQQPDIDSLREKVARLGHISVFEGSVEQGRVQLGDLSESPIYSYGYEPLDPFSQPILYEVPEADWSNEVGRDETVSAADANSLYRFGEVVYPMVSLREDTESISERLDELDLRFSPSQSPDIHDLA